MWGSGRVYPYLDGATASNIARRARALADPRRVRILDLLREGPKTVNELAAGLDLRPARTSLQLSVLRDAGLVRGERRGRCRLYTTDGDLVGRFLEDFRRAGTETVAGGSRKPRRPVVGSALQVARSCYDHLAGAQSVTLALEMEQQGWLVRTASGFVITSVGERELVQRGVDVALCRDARRKLAPACLDWTERRPHVGGSIGRAIFENLISAGYLGRATGRVVTVRRPLGGWMRPNWSSRRRSI
jgi:DNA-binding transcriptional ArsR family regulator/ribosomal protein S19E (S16A)